MWISIVLEGCLIGMLSILAYIIGMYLSCGNITVSRTMAFSTLALSQLFHAFNMRSQDSVLNINFFSNKYLILSLILGILLQVCVVNIPMLSDVFKTAPLDANEWCAVMGLSVMPIVVVELQKLFTNHQR